MLKKKVLILANNPVADTNSNGRTLKNFFSPEDRERLAQMYIHGAAPDFGACDRFFRVSDREVIRSFLKHTDAGHEVRREEIQVLGREAAVAKKRKKSPFRMLMRDFFWNRRRWRRRFFAWIDSVAPDIVLLQAGDSPFMYRLATWIAKERKIPLVIYNSEDYFFQKRNLRIKSSLIFPLSTI